MEYYLGGKWIRTAQRRGKSGGCPDIESEDWKRLHVEVKRTECLRLYEALNQARSESGLEEIPIVWHKKNNRYPVIVVSVQDLVPLCKYISGVPV